jgi:hypothetical protein
MESWIPFFIILTSLAIVVQAVILIALFVQLRRTAARIEQIVADLNTKLGPILSRVQVLVEDVTPKLDSIVSDASELTRLARAQAQKIDRILTETLERVRMQLIHVDQILTGAMEAVEEAGSHLRQTVLGPVVKATALIRGVQAGIDFFRTVRQKREPVEAPAEQQQDEGMFI